MKTFLPFISTRLSVLGVESIFPASQIASIKALGPGWVRYNGVRWPDQINRNQLDVLNKMRCNTIVVVQTNGFIPTILQQTQIAEFITGLSLQYPKITAWELWNEADAPLFGSSYFLGGGWENNPRGYAAFLSTVLSQNPKLTILSSGLAEVGRWIETVLSTSIKPSGISFHSYNYMPDTSTTRLNTKMSFLKSRTSIPLYLTETSVLSDVDNDKEKAQYLTNLYSFAVQQKLRSAIWYTAGGNDWRNSDLEGLSREKFIEITH